MSMQIEVPAIKSRLKGKDLRKSAIAAYNGAKKTLAPNFKAYDLQEGDLKYFPYWVGEVFTETERPFLRPKKIKFYVFCDGITGEFIVLRSFPKSKQLDQDEKAIFKEAVRKRDFDTAIMEEAMHDRIKRQFILFKPKMEQGRSWLIYLPVREVLIKRKTDSAKRKYFCNIFTGEARSEGKCGNLVGDLPTGLIAEKKNGYQHKRFLHVPLREGSMRAVVERKKEVISNG